MTVLDVGCGQGTQAVRLAQQDCLVTAVEPSVELSASGRLSVTFRNGHALAMRPGLRRDWIGALAAFTSRVYVNELGVLATADLLEDVVRDLADAGLEVEGWYGVRGFNDGVASDMAVPSDEDLAALLDAEDEAGRRDRTVGWPPSSMCSRITRPTDATTEPLVAGRRRYSEPLTGRRSTHARVSDRGPSTCPSRAPDDPGGSYPGLGERRMGSCWRRSSTSGRWVRRGPTPTVER